MFINIYLNIIIFIFLIYIAKYLNMSKNKLIHDNLKPNSTESIRDNNKTERSNLPITYDLIQKTNDNKFLTKNYDCNMNIENNYDYIIKNTKIKNNDNDNNEYKESNINLEHVLNFKYNNNYDNTDIKHNSYIKSTNYSNEIKSNKEDNNGYSEIKNDIKSIKEKINTLETKLSKPIIFILK